MTLLARRPVPRAADPAVRGRSRTDVLFAVVVSVLLAVHLTIFLAVLVLAPVTVAEQRALDLVRLPVEVGRALVLPFHALLLGSLFVLGRRSAGRWAGFGAMLAVLALDLRADPSAVIYGPSVATGGWVAASLLAAAMVALPRHRRTAAVLTGVATAFSGLLVLALPAFLVALALQPASRRERSRRLLEFAGCWAAPAAAGQLAWFSSLGASAYADRVAQLLAEFRPHALVPFLEQQRIVFAAWHFPAPVTFALALFLFVVAGIGAARYLLVPKPGEQGSGPVRTLRRAPVELLAGFGTMLLFGVWWALSGWTVVIDPELPVLAAVAPLLTALAYRGAKWLLTVNRFWAFAATVYLIGLILARSTQLVITLVQAFHS